MQEATQGIAIVKAFTMEDQLSRKHGGTHRPMPSSAANKIARVSERLSPIAEMLAGFAVAGVIAYAGYRALVRRPAARRGVLLHHRAAAGL